MRQPLLLRKRLRLQLHSRARVSAHADTRCTALPHAHQLHLALKVGSGCGGGLLLLQLNEQRLVGGAVLLGLRNLRPAKAA